MAGVQGRKAAGKAAADTGPAVEVLNSDGEAMPAQESPPSAAVQTNRITSANAYLLIYRQSSWQPGPSPAVPDRSAPAKSHDSEQHRGHVELPAIDVEIYIIVECGWMKSVLPPANQTDAYHLNVSKASEAFSAIKLIHRSVAGSAWKLIWSQLLATTLIFWRGAKAARVQHSQNWFKGCVAPGGASQSP